MKPNALRAHVEYGSYKRDRVPNGRWLISILSQMQSGEKEYVGSSNEAYRNWESERHNRRRTYQQTDALRKWDMYSTERVRITGIV